MGQRGYKIVNFVFMPYISFINAFTALGCVEGVVGRCVNSLDSWSDLNLDPALMGQTGVIKYPILCFCLISPLLMLEVLGDSQLILCYPLCSTNDFSQTTRPREMQVVCVHICYSAAIGSAILY